MRIVIAAATALLISGCSVFGEPVAEKVAEAVDRYCEEPFNARQVVRETVNAQLQEQGHEVSVTCAGDPAGE